MNNNDDRYDMDGERDIKVVRSRSKAEGFKERIAVMGISLTAAVVVCISIFLIILKRPEISQTENRTLEKFPEFSFSSFFDGEYTAGIDTWYTDTLPGRESFKDYVAKFRGMFGISSEDDVKIHGGIPAALQKKNQSDSKESNNSSETKDTKPADSGSAKTTETTVSGENGDTAALTTAEKKGEDPLDDPNINGEISNNILVYQHRGIMLYGGSYDNGDIYAESLNAFKRDLPNVNVYSMVCPTPVSYYLPSKYSDMTASEKDNIDHINEQLKDVKPVDAWTALYNHKDEKIFQNTDHHWSHLGAFYAAEEFARVADVPFATIDKYDKVEKEGYVGTLYGFTQDSDLKDNPEQFIYYIPKAEYTTEFFTPDLSEQWDGSLIVNIDSIDTGSWYCVFIGTDDCVAHVKTKVKNGRKLAVVKDSYGNALIPWFTSSFEDIYVVDMRYFEVNAVAQFKEWGITDLLFAMNTFSATGSNFENLEVIRTQ